MTSAHLKRAVKRWQASRLRDRIGPCCSYALLRPRVSTQIGHQHREQPLLPRLSRLHFLGR